MSGRRARAQLADGRVVVIEIPARGNGLTLSVSGQVEPLQLNSSDALTVGTALSNAAVYIGQREARARDREAAKRERRERRSIR